MSAQFVLRTTDGYDYVISGSSRIGREADCQIRYNDPAISRHHAIVSVEQEALFVTDDDSANGVFVNGRQIQAGRAHRLRPGDRLRLGNTQIEFEVVAASTAQPAISSSARAWSASRQAASTPGQTTMVTSRPARPWVRLACAGLIGSILLIGFVLLPLAYFLLGGKLPGVLTPISTKVTVLSTSTPPPLLEPEEYAASNEELSSAVTELNQSELDFIAAANRTSAQASSGFLSYPARPAPRVDELDDKLCQIAGNAFKVATLADTLSSTVVAQDGGSDNAGQIASQYTSIVQLSGAIVLDVQDLRGKLANDLITPREAAQVIAKYGARLWNPAITSDELVEGAAPRNPFAAYMADPGSVPFLHPISNSDTSAVFDQTKSFTWIAASGQKESQTFTLPPARPGAPTVDRYDSVLFDKLKTAEGQKTEKDAALEGAAMMLGWRAASEEANKPLTSETITANFLTALAFTSAPGGETPPRTMSAFPNGTGNVVTQNKNSGDVISSLINIGSEVEATVASQVPIKETQPLVALTLSKLVVKQVNKFPKGSSTFEGEVFYELDVQWQGNLASPQFELDCVSGNHFEVTTAGGTQHLSAKGLLLLYPGNEDAYCYASHNGNTWGSTSLRFLVGEADEATQRADQVETDSVSLNLTLTAEAEGTLHVEQTSAAATRAVVGTENALSTEVYGTQTAEFMATVTELARQTAEFTPLASETPLPTPTFEPVLVDTTFHPGNLFAVNTNVVLKSGRLYRVCLSGTMNLDTGPARPSDLDHVNGIPVPFSGCVTLEGNDAVATISCGHGTIDEDEPGGFAIQVIDLGPW